MILRNARPVPLGTLGPDGDGAVSTEPVDVRLDHVGAPDEVVDADGAWVIPGLWDQHVHLAQWSLAGGRFDLAGVTSVGEVVERLEARMAQFPGAPVIGWGHRPSGWSQAPTTADLDAVSEHIPIVLIAGDAHHGWLNSAALGALGLLWREGVVSEDEWFATYARLGDAFGSEEPTAQGYRSAMEAAAAIGVTGLVDFEFSVGPAQWLDLWEGGADLLRIRTATYADGLEAVINRDLRTGQTIGGHRRLTMGALKIISDGSLNTATAWCCEPYAPGAVLPFGEPNQTPEELADLLTRAHAYGLEAAVHAIGDRAVEVALDVFAATGARGSIEHAQLVRPDDVRRIAELGLRASVQPAHLLDDRDPIEHLWPGRSERCFPLRWMLDAGVDLALGSDAPVSPLDPWLAMAAAVHRSADERDSWHPEQSLTAREALAASVDGAPTFGSENNGDFVLLDADPLAGGGSGSEAAAHLLTMKDRVLATYVDGVEVWARPGSPG
ncbi:amidohydrolase [Nocardioides gilvus]|uniref:amidohydrolase n=1 Tax=Nocardioides gilvus TaxID=1735589 RepID=UPI000D741327|nr:amidohydrolase [Nocardioides gilvus]